MKREDGRRGGDGPCQTKGERRGNNGFTKQVLSLRTRGEKKKSNTMLGGAVGGEIMWDGGEKERPAVVLPQNCQKTV